MKLTKDWNGTPDERFWRSIYKTESCWFWIGHIDSGGYGTFYESGKIGLRAHRYSWEKHFGPVPKGLWVLHRCDIRQCVNPEHLFLGTRSENLKDAYQKGSVDPRGLYAVKTHCNRGHEFTPANTYHYGSERMCRICRNAANKRFKKRANTSGVPSVHLTVP